MADWEKRTGTKVNLTFMNGPDLITKLIAGMQVGDVPDLVHSVTGDRFLVPRAAWNDQLEDVTDVMETQKTEFTDRAVRPRLLQRQAEEILVLQRADQSLLADELGLAAAAGGSRLRRDRHAEDAGQVLRLLPDRAGQAARQGQADLRPRLFDGDEGGRYRQPVPPFLVAYGGDGIVSPDGKLNIDDPAVRKAATTALERLTTPYKKGYVPPGAINWGDVDNNNAFFAKQIVMTPNATISIAVAQMDKPDQYYKEIITLGVPLGNDGKPVPGVLAVSPTLIPKGSKNVDAAKALLRDFIRPANLNTYLKETRARYLPVMMSIVKKDPYWTDPKDPHRPVAVDTGLIKPTIPWWMTYNPAYSAVLSEQIWAQAEANITQSNMTPEQATEEAAKRIKQLFEQYQK